MQERRFKRSSSPTAIWAIIIGLAAVLVFNLAGAAIDVAIAKISFVLGFDILKTKLLLSLAAFAVVGIVFVFETGRVPLDSPSDDEKER